MMFQWTDGEVSHVVKLALESVRGSAIAVTVPHHSRLIETLASELSATAWHAHTIDIDAVADYSSTGRPAVDQPLRWTTIASDPVFDWSEFCPWEVYGASLECLLSSVQVTRRSAEEVIHRCLASSQDAVAREPVEQQPESCPHYAIAWLAAQCEGYCTCVEFLKPAGGGPFTMRDEAVLRILSTELLSQPTEAATRQARPQTAKVAELPRRQREVLTALLAGSSVKEIASDLGISPYTVNDYIKALYRRYQVSSRGELMAAVHGLRRSVVPK